MRHLVFDSFLILANLVAIIYIHIPNLQNRCRRVLDWAMLGIQLSSLIMASSAFGRNLHILMEVSK